MHLSETDRYRALAVDMTVADDPESIALASDIGVLSRLLSTARADWSEQTTIPPLLDDNWPEPFSHISNLLSAESGGIVAVVGAPNWENVSATIVYPAESPCSEQDHLAPVTPSGRDWEDILYHEPTPGTPKDYIADLLELLAAVRANKIRGKTIAKWILHRNRGKFQRRLQRSRKDFHYGDLFDVLAQWSPAACDEIRPEALTVFGADRMGGFYLKYGWNVGPATEAVGKFQLGKDTAALLINTIGKVCKEVRSVAEDTSFNWLTSDSTSLVEALNVLGLLLNQKPVEDLFTRTSLSVVLLPREHSESISQAQEDGWDPLTADDCNICGHYALRYMRMLMSWPRAISRFCVPAFLDLLLAAKITVIPCPGPDPCIVGQAAHNNAVQFIEDETLRRLTPWGSKACDAARKWIQDLAVRALADSSPVCQIHGEAGAMAFASEAWSRVGHCEQGDLDDRFLGTAGNVAICTSQRCCFLCSRLADLLEYHYGASNFEFTLPIPHDVVLPWDPPSFGIPKWILKRLRDELKDKLVDLAIKLGQENARTTGTECQ